MGPRNLLILFFSTVAVSLVILIIFFSLFFKNVNLDFNTRLPESAPDISTRFNETSTMNPDSKAEGLMRSTVNVPPESREPENSPAEKTGKNQQPADTDLPPVSDDALLQNDMPQPMPEKLPDYGTEKVPSTEKLPMERSATRSSQPVTKPSRPAAISRPEPQPAPVAMPNPIDDTPIREPQESGPPVPQ